jgi:hypothetical protein
MTLNRHAECEARRGESDSYLNAIAREAWLASFGDLRGEP